MNEELSIGTDIAREPEVALTAPTDAGESVPVDIKHLLVDPKMLLNFRNSCIPNLNQQKRKMLQPSKAKQNTTYPKVPF